MERVIEQRQDLDCLMRLLQARQLPCTVRVTDGRPKSNAQDRLENRWHKEAADQLGDESAEEKRGYAKLTIGVPILRYDSEEFREAYDRVIKPLPYEHKLVAMMDPLDFPVTRLMTTRQKSQYLDHLYDHYDSLGVRLTKPEEFGL